MKTITPEYVDALIDFAPTEAIRKANIAQIQRNGTVALFNMLVRNGLAYLADEVGMGKTYIGLAVMSLLRFQKPDARVLVLTPRKNIQDKWRSDLVNFVRDNWRHADHRVKTPMGAPDFPTRTPNNLQAWLADLKDAEGKVSEGALGSHDTILRTTSFSVSWEEGPWGRHVDRKDFEALEAYLARKPYDLIIVDEAHNLKHGYQAGVKSSLRNHTLHRLFGEKCAQGGPKPWLLMLSATPMENGDPESWVRQFQVFGRDKDRIQTAEEGPAFGLAEVADLPRSELHSTLQHIMVRRVGASQLGGTLWTRNMYRKEWRAGGVDQADLPMAPTDTASRLINAVVQKNVFDLIERQGGRYRVGALESFEVYSGRKSRFTGTSNDQESDAGSAVDQGLIEQLSQSYRRRFEREIPHPKLSQVAKRLAEDMSRCEKSLVFVRRVATTWDLATRVSAEFDRDLMNQIRRQLHQDDIRELDRLETTWQGLRAAREFNDRDQEDSDETGSDEARTTLASEGGDAESESDIREMVPSFFTWFFQGKRTDFRDFEHLYSGRAFKADLYARERLCLVLEENAVDWVLDRPDQPLLEHLASLCSTTEEELLAAIETSLPGGLAAARGNLRRQFHLVQWAVLDWMLRQPALAAQHEAIAIISSELYPDRNRWEGGNGGPPAQGVEHADIRSLLETKGLYPLLGREPSNSPLSHILATGVFRQATDARDLRKAVRRREQVRHLQMALLRNGAPSIALYLAVLHCRGNRLLAEAGGAAVGVESVASTLLEKWRAAAQSSDVTVWKRSGAWELVEVKEQFDLLRKINFGDLEQYGDHLRPLDSVFTAQAETRADNDQQMPTAREYLGQLMVGQAPTVAAQGGQNDVRRHRITSHFRMPGMPWVLVATSVYEEGVDLHTYCKTVIHHGISHTASSVEQRTGRVDRIGGLVQRQMSQVEDASAHEGWKIQSLFPYQPDTMEKHQVRRALANCNRFLRALHEGDDMGDESVEMSMTDRMDEIPPQITSELRSPFAICSDSPWLRGRERVPDLSSQFDRALFELELEAFEKTLGKACAERGFKFQVPSGQGLERWYDIERGDARWKAAITPRSDRDGDHMLIEMTLEAPGRVIPCRDLAADPSGVGWAQEAAKALIQTFPEEVV